MKTNESYCVVMTTLPEKDEADKMAVKILEERLAACIQASEITSHYRWQGKACRDAEILLRIKTRDACIEPLTALILNTHPYDLPEIIKIPVTGGHPAYLDWIGENTRKE